MVIRSNLKLNSLKLSNHFFKAIMITRKGDYIHLKFSDGVRLKWSKDSLNIFVTVENEYINKVSGLCGDYNDESKNDLLLPNGLYTNEVSIFANSWRLDSGVSELEIKNI